MFGKCKPALSGLEFRENIIKLCQRQLIQQVKPAGLEEEEEEQQQQEEHRAKLEGLCCQDMN